mgnify:CR=1 FL=1
MAEREARNSNLLFKLKYELVDKNAAMLERVIVWAVIVGLVVFFAWAYDRLHSRRCSCGRPHDHPPIPYEGNA